QPVLLAANPSVQRLDRVVVAHLDARLKQDGPTVEVVGDEVDGAAADLDPVIEGLLDRVERAAERGQQRRMRVQHAPGKAGDELGHEHFVEAGEHDQVDVGAAQRFEQMPLALDAARVFVAVGQADGHAGGFGAADGGGVSSVAANQGDADGKAWRL